MPKAKTTNNLAPDNFKDAYLVLQNNAKALENSETLDVDNLVNVVQESIEAYKICQARIIAVEQALEAAFSDNSLMVERQDEE